MSSIPRMQHATRGLSILLLFVTAGVQAEPWTQRRAPEMQRLQAGVVRGDLPLLRSAVVRLEQDLEPGPSPERHALLYDLAYLDWRIQLALPDRASAEKDRRLARARSRVDALLASRPDDLEARVLLSAIMGSEADAGALAQLRWGRMLFNLTRENVERDPEHPRARLERGIVLFYTPEALGGGAAIARGHFEHALAKLEPTSADATWPSWGPVDAAAWLGQSLAAEGTRGGGPRRLPPGPGAPSRRCLDPGAAYSRHSRSSSSRRIALESS